MFKFYIIYISGRFLVLFVNMYSVVNWQFVGKYEGINLDMELCEVTESDGV